VTFDLDDTLFLERDYVRSGFRAVGDWAERHLDVRGLADSAGRAFERGVRGTTLHEALADLGVEPTPEVVAQLVAVYRSHIPRVRMLEDARACIEDLRQRAVLAVISDGPRASQQAKATAMATERWAKTVVLTADLGLGAGKPSPKAFAAVEAVTGVSGGACAYVADNPLKDFGGARSCGWLTVRVRRPESLHAALPSSADVDIEVTELRALPTLLEEWLSDPVPRVR
jgi:putative hydrolase of the HAD superfamily